MPKMAVVPSMNLEGGIMHNYDFGPFGEPEGGPRRHSIFSLVAWIVVLAVAAAIVLTIAFWALGIVVGLAGWILKVAILAAVAAFVWRRVNRRWNHDRV
jgi:hypothetical protein